MPNWRWIEETDADRDGGAGVASPRADADGGGITGPTLLDADGRTVAIVDERQFLDGGWSPPDDWSDVLVTWSGSLAESLHDAHPHTWMGPGREALEAKVAAVLATAGTRRLWLRPHARHVLSDAPSCRRFMAECGDDRVGLLLEPAALFEASMLDDAAEDHLERFLQGLGDLTAAVVISDAAPPRTDAASAASAGQDDPAGPCRLVAPGAGRLPGAIFGTLLDRWIPADVPRVHRGDPAAAATWFGAG